MAKSIGGALGSGFAGITKSLDEFGEQLDAEEAASGVGSSEKKGFFEGRDERLKAGSTHPSALVPLVRLHARCRIWAIAAVGSAARERHAEAQGHGRCCFACLLPAAPQRGSPKPFPVRCMCLSE